MAVMKRCSGQRRGGGPLRAVDGERHARRLSLVLAVIGEKGATMEMTKASRARVVACDAHTLGWKLGALGRHGAQRTKNPETTSESPLPLFW